MILTVFTENRRSQWGSFDSLSYKEPVFQPSGNTVSHPLPTYSQGQGSVITPIPNIGMYM